MKIYRDLWIITAVVCVMLSVIEVAGRLVVRAERRSPIRHPVLEHQTWGPQYLRDLAPYRWRHDHHAYVEFRESAYASRSINIAGDGTRVTPGSCQRSHSDSTVLMFGGSTMLGVGVPDEFTVPAYVAAASRSGRCVRVVNYGAGWWQSTQSLVQLIGLLRSGERPNIVVFYDGINDIDVVTYGGTAGGISPDAETLLNLGIHNDLVSVKRAVLMNSGAFSLLQRLRPRSKGMAPSVQPPPADLDRAAAGIVDVYRQNLVMLSALEREYGFVAHAILQPFPLIVDKELTGAEREIFRGRRDYKPWESAFVRQVYDRIRADAYIAARPRFHDLSRMFDGSREELFVDVEHLLPIGNERVGEHIAALIRN